MSALEKLHYYVDGSPVTEAQYVRYLEKERLELAAAKPPERDMVNHPPHYTKGGIECIDAIRAALGDEGFVAYCKGAVIKYSWRTGLKGSGEEDLKKAEWYARKAASVQAEIEAGENPFK